MKKEMFTIGVALTMLLGFSDVPVRLGEAVQNDLKPESFLFDDRKSYDLAYPWMGDDCTECHVIEPGTFVDEETFRSMHEDREKNIVNWRPQTVATKLKENSSKSEKIYEFYRGVVTFKNQGNDISDLAFYLGTLRANIEPT